MTTCRRGDVVLVRFPHSDLVNFSKRPALVVQADDIETEIEQKIIALITSQPRSGPTRIFIEKKTRLGLSMNLLDDSYIVTDNLATVHMKLIEKVIGKCPEYGKIESALKKTLGMG